MNLEFEKFSHQRYLRDQRELFQDAFPELKNSAASEDYYFWKFHQFPADNKSFEYCSWLDSKMVGYYAAIPYPYVIGDKKVICGMVCDVMTHSLSRGKGVFTSIGRFALDDLQKQGVAFTSGYPIRPEVIPGHLKVGWKIILDLPLYVRPVSFNSVLGKWNLNWAASFLNLLPSIYNTAIQPLPIDSSRFRIFSVAEILEMKEYDVFFHSWSETQKNYLVKSREFLRWRLSSPRSDYSILTLWEKDKITALAIMNRVTFNGIWCLALIDFMKLSVASSELRAMHKMILKIAKQKKADIVAAMMNTKTADSLQMARNGFFRTPKSFQLIINKLDHQLPEEIICNQDNWNPMWIDSDDS